MIFVIWNGNVRTHIGHLITHNNFNFKILESLGRGDQTIERPELRDQEAEGDDRQT